MIEFFPSRKIFLALGNLTITWYALLIMTGALIAYSLSKRNMRKNGYPEEYAEDLFIGVLWFGFLGARLWFCAFYDFNFFITHPWKIIAIWDGGLAIHGGFIAAMLYGLYFCKKRGLNPLRLADAVVPNVLIAQAIGRWGNFANQECHGLEVAESYYDGVLSFIKDGMFIDGHYYEPMFLFESIGCIVGFILIVGLLKKRQNKRGDLTFAYLMWYGLIRFFIEGRRTDSLMIGNFKMAQVTSLIYIIIGVLGFIGLLNKFFKEPKATVLFDLDGTLLDTETGIIKSYEYVFEKMGASDKFTNEVRQEVLGPSLEAMFIKYFPDKDPEELKALYREHNAKIFENVNRMMPHADELLKFLKDHGYHVGVVSTKRHDNVLNNLKLYNLDQYVEDIVGGDDVKKHKPSPEGINKILKQNRWFRDELVYVGDNPCDVLAGRAAGAYTIGFNQTIERLGVLEANGANYCTSDLGEIIEIIQTPVHLTAHLD